MKPCKFDIKDMLPIGLTIVVLGIGIAFGLNVMSDMKSDFCTDNGGAYVNSSCFTDTNYNVSSSTAEFNASSDASTGVAKLTSKLPLIVTVIVAAIVIGILIRYLMVRYN